MEQFRRGTLVPVVSVIFLFEAKRAAGEFRMQPSISLLLGSVAPPLGSKAGTLQMENAELLEVDDASSALGSTVLAVVGCPRPRAAGQICALA